MGTRVVPRWLLAGTCVVLLGVVTGGAGAYHWFKGYMRAAALADLESTAQLKVSQIEKWRADQLRHAAIVTDGPFFRHGVTHWLAGEDPGASHEVLERLRSLQKRCGSQDVLLVDAAGRVRLSLSPNDGQVGPEALATIREALARREPVLSDLHAGPGELPPHVDAVAPILPVDPQHQEPVGALILRSNAREFLYPLVQSWPTASRTAETLLVRREGGQVLFLNELRHQEGSGLQLRIPLAQTDVPAVQAVLGHTGVLEGFDYRDVDVLAYTAPIPGSPWFMVSKIDRAEALQAWDFISGLILALTLVLLATLVAFVVVIWQRASRARLAELLGSELARKRVEARQATTLLSIGDAVIATDAQARVELLNPVAEALTGWSSAEAIGRPLEEVFRIVNEQTGQPVVNPVTRVLREGVVVGLANHTVLIARDGSRHPISDSGSPIRDPGGAITGVVLVFRDVTEERRAELALRESELRLRSLFENMLNGLARCRMYFDAEGRPVDFEYLMVNRAFGELTGLKDVVGRRVSEVIPGIREADPKLFEIYGRVASGGPPERFETYVAALKMWFAISVYSPQKDHFVAVFDVITDRKRAEAQLMQAQKMESVGRLAGGVAHDFNNLLMAIMNYAELCRDELPPDHAVRPYLDEILNATQRSTNLARQLLAFARKQVMTPRVLDLNETVTGMLKLLRRLIGEDVEIHWVPGAGVWPVKMDPGQLDQVLANLCVNARDAISGAGRVTIETSNVTLDQAYCQDHEGAIPGQHVLLVVSDDGCGMTREVMEHLFEPFFTTKGLGMGTGLGLSTVYGIVKQNQGFINVYSEPGQGATFRIYLPRAPEDAASEPPAVGRPAPVPGIGTILVVEDERSLRETCRLFLERLGYRVLTAESPAAALDLAERDHQEIHLLLTDVVMPGMNGRDLAERLLARRPGLKCVFMSGYTANVIAHRGVLDAGVHFLQKPFTRDDLATKVRAALERSAQES